MSGVTPLIDTLLATRLAQRVDLVPLKAQTAIAGPGAVAATDKANNDVRLPSRVALDQQLGPALHDGVDTTLGELTSVRSANTVTLSAVARSLRAILELPAGAALSRVHGRQALWSGPPPLAAPLLATTLARMVATSGLFYESHLQKFAAGLRSLELMLREPQAGLSPPASPAAPVNATAVPLAAARPGDAGAAPAAGMAAAPLAAAPVLDAQAAPSEPSQSAAVYGRDGRLGSSSAAFHEIAGHAPDAKTPLASLAGAADSDSSPLAAVIHPDAVALVRQQLELLAAPVFRWSGEAWPGTPMDWDIHEQPAEETGAGSGGGGGGAAQASWTTNLTVTLPTLRCVQARLTLVGNTLRVRLTCDEGARLAVLHDGQQALSRRFAPLGLQLTEFQVGVPGAEAGISRPES